MESACNVGNFTQLVQCPTRCQYNRITGNTGISCIDHVYTIAKFRCSDVVVTSFGGSDHDIKGYTRYSKDPPQPSRTIIKRSYKNFFAEDFLADLRQVDWTEVFQSQDVDMAAEAFTGLFRNVLNKHAPCIIYQQRKHYVPWLTDQKLELMRERDESKASALKLALEGSDSSEEK